MEQNTFIRSNNWWIEEDKAWFVEEMNNILFCVDLDTGECVEAVAIPEPKSNKYKLTPYCMKWGDAIWCIPGIGQYIWIYYLENRQFSKIDIGKQEGVQWAVELWSWQDTAFLVLDRSNKILEIDRGQCSITNLYTICSDCVVRSTMAEGSIYMLTSKSDKIYRFDCNTKEIKSYILPDAGKKFFNICFDGRRFLMCGYGEEICAWEPKSNQLTVIDNFPENFKVYDFACRADDLIHGEIPTFLFAEAVGEYVWFIPWRANKIVYVDKESGELAIFEITEENKSMQNVLPCTAAFLPYIWEYVREDRYIGLFSIRYNCILEIDTKKMKYQWKEYGFHKECVQQCDKIFKEVYIEGKALHDKLYKTKLLTSDNNAINISFDNIGSKIFKTLG